MSRIKMILKGKWSFINYRKVSDGKYPIRGIIPWLTCHWGGDIWHVEWRGYAISIDMRENWLADMVDPLRKHKGD